MPLSVSSSIRLISYGLRIILSLNVFTLIGKVAENRRICRSGAMKPITCSTSPINSGESSLSASSRAIIAHCCRLATPFCAMSRMRPGVAMMMCTVLYRRRMSSFKLDPPVLTMISRLRYLPRSRHTCDVCSASSRVGTRIIAWIAFFEESTFSRTGTTNAAVLPVPFFARARMSRPASAIGIDSSWMGDGRSKPASKIPMSSSRLRK
mmetsp:Transcript_2706/g.6776  ORF Transcript_2706/g.6776 Transcript_2706/m.6776 type:complete len:208 (-) Transcript_2706:366-989(-)